MAAQIDVVGSSGATTNFFDYSKEQYSRVIASQIRFKNPYYDALQRSTKWEDPDLGGRGFVMPLEVERAHNFGGIAQPGSGNDSNIPAANVPTRTRMVIRGVDEYGRFQYGITAKKATEGNARAYLNVVRQNAECLMKEGAESIGRQLVGIVVDTTSTGGSAKQGVVGKVVTRSGGTQITLTTKTAAQFRVKQPLLIDANPSVLTAGNSVTVSSIDDVNKITVSAAGTITANDYISVGKTTSGQEWGSFRNEIVGVEHITNGFLTGDTLHGIAPGTFAVWKPVRLGHSGTTERPLKKTMLSGMPIAIHSKSGEYPDVWLIHPLMLIEVANLMEGDIRYKEEVLHGGFDHNLMSWHSGMSRMYFIPDDNVEVTTLHALTLKYVAMGALYEWEWIEDGSRASRVSNKAAHEEAIGCHIQQLCYKRAAHGAIRQVQVDETLFEAPN